MNTLSLEIERFKSFVEKQVIDFSSFPEGVVYLSGHNEVEPSLGSNGAGKSTVWEAWCWCRYGKTPRTLRSTQVKTWESKGPCRVCETLELDGSSLKIERCVGPNSLRIMENGVWRDASQGDVDALLGLDFTSFIHCVFLGQGVPLFFDLHPYAQTEVLESALRLEMWSKAAQSASSLSRDIDQKGVRSLEQQLAEVNGQLLALHSQRRNLEDLEELKKSLAEAEARLERAKRELKRCGRRLEKVSGLVDHARADVEAQRQKVFAAKGVLQRWLAERVQAQNEQRRAQREYDQLVTLDGASCPTCRQTVSHQHVESCLGEIEAKLERLAADVEAMDEKVRFCEQEQKSEEDALLELQDALRAKEYEFEVASAAHREQVQLLASAQAEMDMLVERVGRASKAAEEVEQSKKRLIEQRDDIQYELDEHKKLREGLQFWGKGFMQVRLLVVDRALDALAIETNSALEQLGLYGWRVEFAVERETKSKTVSKRLTVQFYPPGSQEPVPWGAWSGGESQRLRLAGRMGVADLIASWADVNPSMEVWDEPTQYLSQEGIDDLVEALHRRARMTGRKIWLVDHRSYDRSRFDASVVVRKTERGSLWECEQLGSRGE